MVDPNRDLPIAAAIVLLIAAVFGQTLKHDFIGYDDQVHITQNPHVRDGLTRANIAWAFRHGADVNYWMPITWLSHMLDCEMFGLKAGLHHLMNVILHAAASVTLFFVLMNLTANRWASAWVAALFAIHPMHVESVAWASERKDTLSALAMFLAIGAYAHYTRHPNARTYALSVFVFVLALMCKPMAMTLPVLLLLLDYWPLARVGPVSLKRLVAEKIPFLALAVACGIVTIVAQNQAHAMRTLEQFPIGFRLSNVIVSLGRYLAKLLWPAKQAVFYPTPQHWPLLLVVVSVIVVGAITIWSLVNLRRRSYLSVGWFWFFVSLAPVIGIIQVGRQSMADRYTYIPYVGLFIMIAWGFAECAKRWPNLQRTIIAFAVVSTLAAAVRAGVQVTHWKNTETIFVHAVEVTSENAVAHQHVGNVFARKNQLEEAERHYREAVRIDPDYALAHTNLAHVLYRRRQLYEAIREYERAIQLTPERADAHLGLGFASRDLNDRQRAEREFKEALRLDPALTAARDALAALQRSSASPTTGRSGE